MYLEWQHGDSSRAFRRSWSSQACLEMKALHESVHWILQKIWKKAWSTATAQLLNDSTAQLHYLDPSTIVNYTRTLVEICFAARLNGHGSLVFLVNTVRFSSSTWEPQWPLIMLRRRIFFFCTERIQSPTSSRVDFTEKTVRHSKNCTSFWAWIFHCRSQSFGPGDHGPSSGKNWGHVQSQGVESCWKLPQKLPLLPATSIVGSSFPGWFWNMTMTMDHSWSWPRIQHWISKSRMY